MLRNLRTRRRPRYGAHICALLSALLLLLSVTLLYSRLTIFSQPRHPHHSPRHPHLDPLLDDPEDPLTTHAHIINDPIDQLDTTTNTIDEEDQDQDQEEDDQEDMSTSSKSSSKSYFFYHLNGVVRRNVNKKSIDEWEDYSNFESEVKASLGFDVQRSSVVAAFGSDDVVVDEKVKGKLTKVKEFEDVLLLKGSGLREGWGEWFEKKGDFLRRDRMFKSNLEVLNPLNNPMLQDPDGIGVTGLTRGDRIVQKGILNEFKKVPFLIKKPLSVVEEKPEMEKKTERRTLDDSGDRTRIKEVYGGDGKRWGYYPGINGKLSFRNFMDAFLRKGRCNLRVFMVWNSPPWTYSVRYQRGLESVLYHHPDACVVVFSETIELNFFSGFVKDGFKVAVVMPNLDELLKDTPTHIFASVWHEWRKTKHYPVHFSELIRLAALYKYGGIYLDSDIIVLKPLTSLNNTVGLEDEAAGDILNGAVMTFRKHSPFIMECLNEFYASYDDTQLRWNGAGLLTRVANNFTSNKNLYTMELKVQSSFAFFPIGSNHISRFFTAPGSEAERAEQDILFERILNESFTVHLWNSFTSALVPDPESLVARIINHHCLRCSDVL